MVNLGFRVYLGRNFLGLLGMIPEEWVGFLGFRDIWGLNQPWPGTFVGLQLDLLTQH